MDFETDILHRAHGAVHAPESAAHLECLGQVPHRQKRVAGDRFRLLQARCGRAPDQFSGGDFLMAMAARQPAGIGGQECRFGFAHRDLERTAWREAATGLRVGEIGRQAFDGFELGAARAVEARHRAKQSHRIGMTRAVEYVVGFAFFDEARGIHHDHAVGIARDHAEIMCDDDERDIQLARQILHQFEDLRLDGDVERGGRLVGDQQRRFTRNRHGDHHALPHAAG